MFTFIQPHIVYEAFVLIFFQNISRKKNKWLGINFFTIHEAKKCFTTE